MPRLLLTGFEPFHTHPENPSARAVEALRGLQVGEWCVQAVLLPVEPRRAGERLTELLSAEPDAVLLTGLAAGRPQVTLERVAVNMMDFAIPDNAGQTYCDAPICEAPGPAAYLATLPLRDILRTWQEAGIPGRISNSAGLYVCNYVLYHALHELAQQGRAVPCGFLHVPANAAVALAQSPAAPPMPYLPQSEINRAVRLAAETTILSLG